MTRQELYQHFGPKLIDALARIMLEEINILRAAHGFSERTPQQMVTAIGNQLEEIPDYDWMET